MGKKTLVREYVEAITIALLLALFLRGFVVQAFHIPSGSMIPTLLIGDQLLVDKITYRFREPERGEIIVFEYPKNRDRDFIKRIIGLPGEVLEVKHRQVYINGKPIKQEYAWFENEFPTYLNTRENYGPVTIPQGKYFMMGDNRQNSSDSRVWGFMDRSLIIGKAFIIYWSRDKTGKTDSLIGLRFSRFGHLLH